MRPRSSELAVRAAALLASGALVAGCVPMMAASLAGMAVKQAQKPGPSNVGLKPQAEAACVQRASAYGAVHVIDVQQKRTDLIIVWGTAGEGAQKRSFECHFRRELVSFQLREIRPAR